MWTLSPDRSQPENVPEASEERRGRCRRVTDWKDEQVQGKETCNIILNLATGSMNNTWDQLGV